MAVHLDASDQDLSVLLTAAATQWQVLAADTLDGDQLTATPWTSGQAPIGIAVQDGLTGEMVPLRRVGEAKAVAGGSISAWDDLAVTTGGKLVAASAASAYVVGKALQDASTNDVFRVWVWVRPGDVDMNTLAAVTDGAAGADSVGATPNALTGTANTVQEILDALTTLLAAVTDGAAGADNVGATPITETGAAATVQGVLEALVARLKAVTDGSAGADLVGATAITETGAANTVQGILEGLVARLKATTDNTSGADLIAITAIATLGAAASVQAALEAIATQIGDLSTLETTEKTSLVGALNEIHT